MIELRINQDQHVFQVNELLLSQESKLLVLEDKIFFVDNNENYTELKNEEVLKLSDDLKIQVVDFASSILPTKRKLLNNAFEEIQKKHPDLLEFLKGLAKK